MMSRQIKPTPQPDNKGGVVYTVSAMILSISFLAVTEKPRFSEFLLIWLINAFQTPRS